MDKPVSKRRRGKRSTTPEKPKHRKKIAFAIKNSERPQLTRFNSVFQNLREKSETPEPVINSKKTPELESIQAIFIKNEPEVEENPEREMFRSPERDTENEKSYKNAEQLKVSLPINLFDNNEHRSKKRRKNATKNNNCKQRKNENNENTKQETKNKNNTTENHNYDCECICCSFKRKEEEGEILYVDTVQLNDSQRPQQKVHSRIIAECLQSLTRKTSLLLERGEFHDTTESIRTTVDATLHTLDEKITNIEKSLTDINVNHDKNWESVSETLAIISKHIIDSSNIGSKGKDNHESGRNLESPTTTSDNCEEDILQKAEQFSEQNKAKLIKEKAENERNERARTMDSQTLPRNQTFVKITPTDMPHQQQITQKTQDQLAKQQFAQHETQIAWQLDQQTSTKSIELKEQQVRQQIVNFYQQQQNTRLEIQKACQFEQQMAAQRKERTARQQEYEQAQASQNIVEQLEQIIRNNEQIAQQQQLVGQHEQLMARHNERLALQQAQLAQQQFAKQQEIQLANEPTLNRDGMVVNESTNMTPTNQLTEQRVLRPRPTPQVVLQYPFVKPKQKAPRKLTAKQIRERRASVQCEPPTPSHYSHLPSMGMPTPMAQEAPVQRNMRLADENFQQQVPLPQVYTALQNQGIQQHQAAKLRARRASCQPSLSYLDQGLCHEMLRRRLTNAQVPDNHEQSSFYPQQQHRYFSNTPQPGNTNDTYSQYTQNVVLEIATPANGLNLSVNNVEKTSQNLSQDPVSWMRDRSTSITRI